MLWDSKVTSWRSYLFLIASIITSLSMILLDPLSQATSETISDIVASFIIVGLFVSVVMIGVTFFSKREKKLIPTIALIITLLNIGVIIFLAWT
ncbi:hypothetical protein [Oceanobacillus alkalisoli]|uniref:hypothetical protein n=1 Tax=Oceanobacillus alkalisoli TaxID=2925113 RepID=UPI001EF09111|nr:hypothetical protein [Oceanobacillus alkalisoli]MCF3942705.1 hypothetical protein [Oceanobacillus alkalisoli]MCG5102677.1 hypothetical protein [Oceanobacillus alkalisoli]